MYQLILAHLSKRFGSVKAVDDISVKIKKGELTAILGPSGSGKSTLLSCIAGIEQPDHGSITVNHTCMFDDQQHICLPPEKRGMSFVFQEYALWPHMKVHQNVSFPLRVRKVPKQKIAERLEQVFDLFHLKGKEDRYPYQLSGGEQQRVSIARALVTDPDLLLLDEPLSHLDASLKEEMQREIRRIQQSMGLTVIYVTHDQIEALSISDHLVVMDYGHILQQGTPRDVYRHPENSFVAGFVGTNNLLIGAIKEHMGIMMLTVGGDCLCPISYTPNDPFKTETMLAVRPEDITMKSYPDILDQQVGIIIKSIFKGALQQCWVAIHGYEFIVYTENSTKYPLGSEVYLAVSKVTLVPD